MWGSFPPLLHLGAIWTLWTSFKLVPLMNKVLACGKSPFGLSWLKSALSISWSYMAFAPPMPGAGATSVKWFSIPYLLKALPAFKGPKKHWGFVFVQWNCLLISPLDSFNSPVLQLRPYFEFSASLALWVLYGLGCTKAMTTGCFQRAGNTFAQPRFNW